MLKHLRVAVTALSLTACVLLIALWVRSYWWADGVGRALQTSRNTTVVSVGSNYGGVVLGRHVDPEWFVPPEIVNRWGYISDTARPVSPSFDWKASSRQVRIEFPIWSLALFAASLAAVPWLPWRFSLRTLLIATTLIAVVLGIVVAAM
jgi:hypothetical protein